MYVLLIFIYQAVGGIRDAQETRGLGYVYNRQDDASLTFPSSQAPSPLTGWGRLRVRSFSHSASKALRALGQASISLLDNVRAMQPGCLLYPSDAADA